MKPLVVDVHAHYTPALMLERFAAHAHRFPLVKLAPLKLFMTSGVLDLKVARPAETDCVSSRKLLV